MDVALPVCGFIVGVLVGFTGMGGGSVMTALLILVFGLHPVSAVGTDLLFAAVTKSVGTRVHASHGNVDWHLVRLLAIGSVPGTLMALALLTQIPAGHPLLARAVTSVLGCALLLAAASFLMPTTIARLREQLFGRAPDWSPRGVVLATVVLGLALGIVVSLTSVGAGAFGLAMLRQLYPERPAVGLVGTDIAHAVPLTILAGAGHWFVGEIQWQVLGLLLLGSVPGIVVASLLASRVRDQVLRPVLGAVLGALAVPLLLR